MAYNRFWLASALSLCLFYSILMVNHGDIHQNSVSMSTFQLIIAKHISFVYKIKTQFLQELAAFIMFTLLKIFVSKFFSTDYL